MTVKAIGMWEFGWNTPIIEADQWEYVCREYGVDSLHMVPVSGIQPEWSSTFEHVGVPEALAELGLPAVIIDEHGETDLREFVHPESCIYVCGRASCSALQYMRDGDVSVRIDSPTHLGVLWAPQALGIVLYDRHVKG